MADMKNRLSPLIHTLTQNTVLGEWFKPMQAALDRVRYPDKVFGTSGSGALFWRQLCHGEQGG